MVLDKRRGQPNALLSPLIATPARIEAGARPIALTRLPWSTCAAGHRQNPSRKARGRKLFSVTLRCTAFKQRKQRRRGSPLCLCPEFAMFRIGQHCCPNLWPVAKHPLAALPANREEKVGGEIRERQPPGRGRVVRWRKSSRGRQAARRLPPEFSGSPLGATPSLLSARGRG